MAGTSISRAQTVAVRLTMSSQNPVTVTSTGSVIPTAGTYAIYGSATYAWTISNAGILSDQATGGVGVKLMDGGSIGNTGLISGALFGVDIRSDAGAVVNQGSIAGTAVLGASIGVNLEAGGTVSNATAGAITGEFAGVNVSGGAGAVINQGTIGLTNKIAGVGILMSSGGMVSNAAGASINGPSYGVAISGGEGTVANQGLIEASYTNINYGGKGRGVFMASGTVTNAGEIYGFYGVRNGAGTVDNQGTIVGFGNIGVELGVGLVTNAASSQIYGFGYSVYEGGGVGNLYHSGTGIRIGSGTVINAGRIRGYGGQGNNPSDNSVGVAISSGGTVTNAANASITGINFGVDIAGGVGVVTNAGTIVGTGQYRNLPMGGIGADLAAGGTLTNAGTIIGASGVAVVLGGTGSNLLVLDPGAVFSGVVSGNIHASNRMELASASSVGTLSGLNSGFGISFSNFGEVTVDANAAWDLTGTNTLARGTTLTNKGTLTLSDATLTGASGLVNNSTIVLDLSHLTVARLTGDGATTIGAGSQLDVQAAVASGETIAFAGGGSYLDLGNPGRVTGSVTNFDTGEVIDLQGINPASVTLSGGQLQFTGGSFSLSLADGASAVQAVASGDGAEVTALCFCADTLIQTPNRDVAVQDLAIGDPVLTLSGATRRIVWIGTGKVLATRARRSAATPVIVRKGALGGNTPHRDLRITKGHALYIDGVLIPVEELINQRSILWDDRAQEVAIYHIELDTHDVLIADGAPAESYRDDGNRWLFQNANSTWGRSPQPPCAPVLNSGPIVDAIWRRLLERTGLCHALAIIRDPDLHLVVDGKRIDAIERHDSRYVFRLGAKPRAIRLRSRSAVPQELGVARDPRPLGVAVRRIVLAQARRQRAVEPDAASLIDGYHAFEPDNGIRWTDGDAAVPAGLFADMSGSGMLILHLGEATQYLAEDEIWRVA